MNLIQAWIDCVFPPLCQVCKTTCRTRLLCHDCWELCSLPDPIERCRHCFGEIEREEEIICQKCKRNPVLSFPTAFVFESTAPAFALYRKVKEEPETIAAFAIVQWERLNWPVPDAVIPLPRAERIAKPFAFSLECPYARVLSRWGNNWECNDQALKEDQTFLLIGEKVSEAVLREAAEILSDTFPKKL